MAAAAAAWRQRGRVVSGAVAAALARRRRWQQGGGCGGSVVVVGERRTNGMLEILPDIEILPDANFEVPCTQNGIVVPRVQNGIIPLDRRAPIKMVSGRAWSPGIYQSLRLLGKSLDVAWERAFIHPLTLN